MEQRFGRIRRIGQTEAWHLRNLVSEETRVGGVYRRLLEHVQELIEVKGRITGAGSIAVTNNEILTRLNKPDEVILAVVEFLDGAGGGEDRLQGRRPGGSDLGPGDNSAEAARDRLEALHGSVIAGDIMAPLDAIIAAPARQESICHGHPSTLQLW